MPSLTLNESVITHAGSSSLAAPPVAVALFNDTGSAHHVGCLAVSRAHRLMLRRAGAVVRHAYCVEDWMRLGTGSVAAGIERALSSDELLRVFADVDAVVVNGEGTIHHGYGRHLLAILGAGQRLGLPTLLVNAVLQEIEDGIDVLRALDDCTVRDARSSRYLDTLGVPHRLVPDSIFETDFAPSPRHDFRHQLIVTDCHPYRVSDFAALVAELRASWTGSMTEYPLEAPQRAADWHHAVADFRQADAIVTGRHHGACLALRAGVPFVTLPSNTWKVEGFLELLEGYPVAAADSSRPLAERITAAMAARDWFVDAAATWNGRTLDTFARLRASAVGQALTALPRAQHVNARLMDTIRGLHRPGAGVLHVGAGQGELIKALLADGISAFGVDVSTHLIGRLATVSPGRFFSGSPVTLPFDDGQFGTVVVDAGWIEHLEAEDLPAVIAEIARVTADAFVFETSGRPLRAELAKRSPRSREWWEHHLLEAGLRRHPRLFATTDYESFDRELHGARIVMQLPPAQVLSAAEPTTAAPGGHPDMLRQAGPAADACLARYEWARAWIKPGDVVVDAGCGAGYGTAMLWDGSEAARVVGLDIAETAVTYARHQYGPGRAGIEFRAVDAGTWDAWPENSVDCVVALGLIDDVPDATRFLDGLGRVLKPGGRLLCSIAVDRGARWPGSNAGLRTIDGLVQVFRSPLLVDEVYAQQVGGRSGADTGARRLRRVDWRAPSANDDHADFRLVTAMKDPLVGTTVPYVERLFPADGGNQPNVTAFGRDYLHPWAVHAVVMGGFRARSPQLLVALATRWLAMSPLGSADAGAALCVLAYQALEDPGSSGLATLLAHIDAHCRQSSPNAHATRWRVSLRFVEGTLRLRRGEFAAAEACFRACAGLDATTFTPHLETKCTEAAWLAGRLALERGDRVAAAACWTQAFAALERMRSASVAEWLVTPSRPAAFESGDGLREIALAVDNATLSANALRKLGDPACAWRPGGRPVERNFGRMVAHLAEEAREAWGTANQAWVDAQGLARELESVRTQKPAPRTPAAGFRDRAAIRVGVFGTGAGALVVSEALSQLEGVTLAWFADSNPNRQGGTLLWVDVIAPDQIARRGCDLIVIGSMHVGVIADRLAALKIQADRILAADVTAGIERVREQVRERVVRMQAAKDPRN